MSLAALSWRLLASMLNAVPSTRNDRVVGAGKSIGARELPSALGMFRDEVTVDQVNGRFIVASVVPSRFPRVAKNNSRASRNAGKKSSMQSRSILLALFVAAATTVVGRGEESLDESSFEGLGQFRMIFVLFCCGALR
jgi:hypothetical protein